MGVTSRSLQPPTKASPSPSIASSHRTTMRIIVLLSASVSAFSGVARNPEFRCRRIPTAFYAAGTGSDVANKNNNHPKNRIFAGKKLPASQSLQYRSNDEGDSIENDNTPDSMQSRWWNSFLAPAKKNEPVDQSSQEVDKYLEFLDKRYNQLHSDEQPNKKAFSAWNWLHQGSEENEVESMVPQEDALYALGVAGLASRKLLQKHHLDPSVIKGEDDSETSPAAFRSDAIDASVIPAMDSDSLPTATRLSMVLSVLVTRLGPVLGRLAMHREKLVRFQAQKLRAASRFLLATPQRAALRLWKLGGGGKTVVWTTTVVAAIALLMLKPVAQAILSVGTSS